MPIPPQLPSRRYRYMTARCPQGCGWWSIPPAVSRHVNDGRCRGVPWPQERRPGVLVAAGAPNQPLLALLPDSLKREPRFSDRARSPLTRDPHVPGDVLAGTVVDTPIPDVDAHRWLAVVTLGVQRIGSRAAARALTGDGFAALEAELGPIDGHVDCPACGQWVSATRLAAHQLRNARCRWLVAHRRVEAAWADGWRDPWSLRPQVPARWTQLVQSRWRRFVRTVEYPQWTAVLVDRQRRLSPPALAGLTPMGRSR